MEFLRGEYLDHMTFSGTRRPMFVELFGLLVGLEAQWRDQGASDGEIDLTAFGFDQVRKHHVAVRTGFTGGEPGRILKETDEYVIGTDSYGRRTKLYKQSATIPLPMDHPVTDMDSWLKIKAHYEFAESRFGEGWKDAAREARKHDSLIVVDIAGGFDEARQLMGEENLCLAYYEQPELIHDILQTIGNTAERVLDRVSRDVQVDVLSVHEDMAGKSGALAGPVQIKEFIRPYFRRIWDMLSSRGARLFQMDSDGNMNSVIPAFLDCGLNCMLPMEPAAGMDIVQIREQHGRRLALMGGIDKHVIRRSKEEIRKELEYNLQPMVRAGTVFGLDHRIPNGTPLENYRYYVKTAREILGLEPNPKPGWARMAF